MTTPQIKNLIFDLGGVILDLSVEDTLKRFSDLSGMEEEAVKKIFIQSPEFLYYEKGELTDNAFRDFVRSAYHVDASDQALDAAWNAMLLGIPPVKLELLKTLQQQYRVFLLSNTNGIHLNYINQVIIPKVSGFSSLDDHFHKAYYSHKMGKRKPDVDIYDQVLRENYLAAEETLFLDDNASNIEGAKALNIQTVHVTSPDHILNYFHATRE